MKSKALSFHCVPVLRFEAIEAVLREFELFIYLFIYIFLFFFFLLGM